jgi:GNAT superfamily N-acetyltransferase
MRIVPFQREHLPAAAALFVENFKRLRASIPQVPDLMEDPGRVAAKLERLLETRSVLAALEGGRLAGYLGWFVIEDFRNAGRQAAYCPEWAHAALEIRKPEIYQALYRAAAAEWAEAGCQVHAVTLLAEDPVAEKTWFWSGFGLAVVDAIRGLEPLGVPAPEGFSIRPASPAEAGVLAVLEEEHARHYAASPVFMVPQPPAGAAEFEAFLEQPGHSVWAAWAGSTPAGYMRFEASSFGAAAVVGAEDAVANTGAYVRPAYRGRRLAPAILDAALQAYAALGFKRCSVDFEAFNPEAAAFWLKYFRPVCLSLMRIPEKIG